ncbi:hypothetical protein RHGRI_030886 [Rhododendron griersonianum]|uniref:Uncharacterized protein n=1 Tax=Rhododendron griersonianum TaxID=479676 RepID=A0AAV6I675_9ERIC|nr:hypothetical protein RHGRI_030886 [Rhododendron griersonianum]
MEDFKFTFARAKDVTFMAGMLIWMIPGEKSGKDFLQALGQLLLVCGLTTLVDMPLNSFPSTVSKKTFELKAAEKRIHVDVGFWGGLVPKNAFNRCALDGLLKASVLGLKAREFALFSLFYFLNLLLFVERRCVCVWDMMNYHQCIPFSFMCPSGINDFPMTNAGHIKVCLNFFLEF